MSKLLHLHLLTYLLTILKRKG